MVDYATRRRREVALEMALERTETAVREHPVSAEMLTRKDPRISAAETLLWMYGLRDWHIKAMGGGKKGRKTFKRKAKRSDGGRTLLALVRTRKLEIYEHREFTAIGLEITGNSRVLWTATGLAGIDDPDNFHRTYVAGKPLLAPLKDARSFLLSLP